MNTEEIKRAMTEFSEAGTQAWDFSGGEPLLRKDIGKLINYAKELGFSTVLVTNGLLVRRKIKELKKVDVLDISLDGPMSINDKLRGKGVFEKVIKNIKIAKKEGIKVHITSVISKLNTENDCYGIKKLLELAESLNCPIYFQPLYESEYNRKLVKELVPLAKNYLESIRIIKNFKAEKPHFLQSSNTTLRWFMNLSKRNVTWQCLAGRAFAFLFPDGLIAPCFFKEDVGINGLEKGFLNAFNSLSLPEQNCKCGLTCCVESNFLYSLNLNEIFSQFKRMGE
jgi:MoaA/NifB/PqqE/SkfB family radical SAM enzyme